MKVNGLKNIKTRQNIVTLHGYLCPLCFGTGVHPRTRLRCPRCHNARSVRPLRLSL